MVHLHQITSGWLTGRAAKPNPATPVGWMAAFALLERAAGEESPGSTGLGCRVTPGGGNPRESATETNRLPKPTRRRQVRVKRCGKSAPRSWQQGLARQTPPGAKPNRGGTISSDIRAFSGLSPGLVARSLWQHKLQMNGHPAWATMWTEPGL
jgi:hypothetical protein